MSTTTITDLSAIASYNRGPLTTVFTPPSSCLSTFTSAEHLYFGHAGTSYYDSACYPSSRSSTYTLLADNGNWNQYYCQCPDAWAHATTFTSYFTNAADSSGQVLFSLGTKTTAVLCCPSGYVYVGSAGHQCGTTILSSGAELLYATTSLSNNVIVLAKPATTTISSAYTIWGDGIPIWWESSDLEAFTAPAQTTTTPLPNSTHTESSTTATSTNSPSLASNPKTGSLSSGAKIAIGITIPVLLITVILGIFFYFRRHGKSSRLQHTFGGEEVDNKIKELTTDGAISELESHFPHNGVRQEPYELPNH